MYIGGLIKLIILPGLGRFHGWPFVPYTITVQSLSDLLGLRSPCVWSLTLHHRCSYCIGTATVGISLVSPLEGGWPNWTCLRHYGVVPATLL